MSNPTSRWQDTPGTYGSMRRVLPSRRSGERCVGRDDEGSISLLILGLTMVAIILVLGTMTVTSVQIARMQLLDAADGAALVAANGVDRDTYDAGLGETIPLTDATVSTAAAQHLAERDRPDRVVSWSLGPGTGTPDGETAHVILTGEVQLPGFSWVTGAFGTSVTVTVQSDARAPVTD